MPPRRGATPAVAAVSLKSARGARGRVQRRRRAVNKSRTLRSTNVVHDGAVPQGGTGDKRTVGCLREGHLTRGRTSVRGARGNAVHAAAVISLDRLRALARPVNSSPAPQADFAHLVPSAVASPPLSCVGGPDGMSTVQRDRLYGNEEDEEESPECHGRSGLVAPRSVDFDPRDAEDEEATVAVRSSGTANFGHAPGTGPSLPSPLDTDVEEDEAATVAATAQRRLTMMRLRAAQASSLWQPPTVSSPAPRRQRQSQRKRANRGRTSRSAAHVPHASAVKNDGSMPKVGKVAAVAATAPNSLSKRSLSAESMTNSRRKQYRRIEVVVDNVTIPVPRSCQVRSRGEKCQTMQSDANQATVRAAATMTSSASARPTRAPPTYAPPDPPTPLTPNIEVEAAPFACAAAVTARMPPLSGSGVTGQGRRKTAKAAKETDCAVSLTSRQSGGQCKNGAATDTRHVVFDTSSLLNGEPGILNLLKEKAVVCIPFTVIDELDRLNKNTVRDKKKLSEQEKTERQWRMKRAREVRNWVTAGLKRKDGMMRVQKRAEVIEEYNRNAKNNDDAILGFAVYLAREKHNVFFVSEDKFLRIKAETELGKACSIDDIKRMLHVHT